MEKKTQGTRSLSHSGEYRESFKPENLPLNYKKPKEQEMPNKKPRARRAEKETKKKKIQEADRERE